MTKQPTPGTPDYEAVSDYIGHAISQLISEALEADPGHWIGKVGAAVEDVGGDILHITVAGETLLFVDRDSLIDRARAIASVQN